MTHSVLKIHLTGDFQKAFRKLPKHIRDLTVRKDAWFRQDAFDPRLRTHKLKGPLEGYFAYSINLQYRVLFRFINAQEVIYYDIGTHSIYV